MTPSNTDPKDPQAELREAIDNTIYWGANRNEPMQYRLGDYLADNPEAYQALHGAIASLFQAHQQELLTELLGELPSYWDTPRMEVIRDVQAVIERYRERL